MHRAGKPSMNDCGLSRARSVPFGYYGRSGVRGVLANIADFRRTALRLPEATEGAHMGHPDFRVRNKIFASL